MSVCLVTWDLNKEKANYAWSRDQFLAKLEQYENTKDPGLDSVYFISSTRSEDEVSNDLRSKLDNNDRLIVVKMTNGNHQGWLSKETWDWINSRL